jgi:Tfp pilus assembly protein PilV
MKAIKQQLPTRNSESGFALLMTLIVVTVVISIGLSVLDLTIKQVRLSTNARDSEIAFHAANAGMECARFWRRSASDEMEAGDTVTINCFSSTVTPTQVSTMNTAANEVWEVMNTADGEVYRYSYALSWGEEPRCSQITALVASSSVTGTGLVIPNMTTLVPGYPGTIKDCEAGERCTVLSVRGYNKSCTDVSQYGTVQREVLLQF